jgi:hypothetical protein
MGSLLFCETIKRREHKEIFTFNTFLAEEEGSPLSSSSALDTEGSDAAWADDKSSVITLVNFIPERENLSFKTRKISHTNQQQQKQPFLTQVNNRFW